MNKDISGSDATPLLCCNMCDFRGVRANSFCCGINGKELSTIKDSDQCILVLTPEWCPGR